NNAGAVSDHDPGTAASDLRIGNPWKVLEWAFLRILAAMSLTERHNRLLRVELGRCDLVSLSLPK
ncbi:MAG TPA: hypothetical protein VIT18_00695, partial [Terrimicrobiaceae bacterium]